MSRQQRRRVTDTKTPHLIVSNSCEEESNFVGLDSNKHTNN